MKKSKLVAVLILIATVSLFDCKAQNQLDPSILTATNRNINDGISELLWMGFLKVCKNTNAPKDKMSTACEFVYEPGASTREDFPQSVAEIYWTKIKGDNSLKEARTNPFKLKQARAELKKKEGEALSAIEGYEIPMTHYYWKKSLRAESYDFDKGVLPLSISAGVTVAGRMAYAQYYQGSVKNPIEISNLEIKMSEEKASELFSETTNREVIVDVLFKDFFEPQNNATKKTTGVIVSKVQVYDGKTGKLLFSHDL